MAKMSAKEANKQRWMRRYAELAVEMNPKLAGRICWDTATYQFNQGINVYEAAKRAVERP